MTKKMTRLTPGKNRPRSTQRPPKRPICAEPGCDQPLPDRAIEENDPFHSTDCARAHYARAAAGTEPRSDDE